MHPRLVLTYPMERCRDLKRWFLVSVKPNQQKKAAINLQQQDIDTYSPQVSYNDGHSLKIEAAFPTYVFAHFDSDVQSVSDVNNTRGVNKLISFSAGAPAIVQDDIIDILRSQFDELEVDVRLKKGDRVIISEGAFAGITAIFKSSNAFERSVLLMKLVGRTQEITVDSRHVVRM